MAQQPGLEQKERIAEPLVLVPGLMSDARIFSDQIVAFGGERAVHLAPICDGLSIGDMARRVLETAPARFAVMGQGLGALVAMDMLRIDPARVTRIAMVTCSPLAETPQEAATREDRIVSAKAGLFEQVARAEVPDTALAPGTNVARVHRSLELMLRTVGSERFLRQSRAMQRRPDMQKVLRRMRAPALVLSGAHDTIIPPRRHEFMAELIPHAEYKVLENAGHMPLLESPAEVTAALKPWLCAPFRLV